MVQKRTDCSSGSVTGSSEARSSEDDQDDEHRGSRDKLRANIEGVDVEQRACTVSLLFFSLALHSHGLLVQR